MLNFIGLILAIIFCFTGFLFIKEMLKKYTKFLKNNVCESYNNIRKHCLFFV